MLSGLAESAELVSQARAYRKNDRVLRKFRDELERAIDNHPESFGKPDYGIVVTSYKNPDEVKLTLSNLISEVGISPSDILVADDHSDDGGKTVNAARGFGVKVIESRENTNKVGVQKLGVEELLREGKEYAVTFDSDTVLNAGKKKLENAMIEMNLLGLDAMAGRILPEAVGRGKKTKFIEKLQYLEYNQAMRLGKGSMYSIRENPEALHPLTKNAYDSLREKYSLEHGDVLFVMGAFGIYKTKTLKEVLDEQTPVWTGEDFEHTLRILGKNKKIGYDDDLPVKTLCPNNLRDLTRQRIRWEEGYFRVHTDPKIVGKVLRDENGMKRHDKASRTLKFQIAKEVLAHPLKLADIPFVAMEPAAYASLAGFYWAANAYACTASRREGEPVFPLASATLPLYRAYNVLVPRTIGYAKNAGERLGNWFRHGRSEKSPTTTNAARNAVYAAAKARVC